MILSTHALTGAVIGKNIESPAIIIILSIVIHFLMDTLRHGEYFDSRNAKIKNTWWKVTLDISFSLITISLIAFFQEWNKKTLFNVGLGMFFSMLPDGMSLLYYCKIKSLILEKIKKFHTWMHSVFGYTQYGPERDWNLHNALNDIIISTLAIIILLFF